jgi:small subunit ribosomal protein S20
MANIQSAKKRIKTSQRNRLQNKQYTSTIKTLTKKYLLYLKDLDKNSTPESIATATNSLSLLYSKLDKAKKRNVLKKNTVARRKSKLSKQLKQVLA